MKVEVFLVAAAAARHAARFIAASAHEAVAARGQFVFAVSRGRSPWQMLRDLAHEDVPWRQVQLFQVDERLAPAGDADRNLTHIRESLVASVPLPQEQVHAMPVELSDLEAGAAQYSLLLEQIAGRPPVLDLIHLGLGPDGHTASLTPNDPVLNVMDRDVATTGIYQGRPRMTLTYPTLNRARRVLWLVTGSDKRDALRRLRQGDPSIPAGRVRQENAVVLADYEAVDSITELG